MKLNNKAPIIYWFQGNRSIAYDLKKPVLPHITKLN